MSALKHTPGPWEVAGGHIIGARVETGSLAVVAECPVWHPHLDANLAVIAAAPELLEALQFVMSAHGEQLDTAFAQAQAAIAKATGGAA